jgi:hypothetical protein
LNQTIVLTAGETFAGKITLPNKETGSGWIYIQSSAYANLPAPGRRVGPSDASNMATITGSAATVNAVLTASNAHHYRFVGIEFKPVSESFVYNLIQIGDGETSTGTLPNNITIDRCYIHGDPTVGGRRGIAMNGSTVAVVDSYISDFKEEGADSQAIWAANTPGPIKIYNSYLEGAGENVLFGGADPTITNCVPSDIEFRQNTVWKNYAWKGSSWQVKNLFELKNAKRALIEGNTFRYCWLAAQDGWAILFTVRNQDGGAPWSAVQDITFRYNQILNTGQGIEITGDDNEQTSQRTARINIEHNLWQVTKDGHPSDADGKGIGIYRQPNDVRYVHNTLVHPNWGNSAVYLANRGDNKSNSFEYSNNLVSAGGYGFWNVDSSSCGTSALNHYFTEYSWENNGFIDPQEYYDTCLPASETSLIEDVAAVEFVNYSGGDYRLSSGSDYAGAGSDSKDLGADLGSRMSAHGSGNSPHSMVISAGGGSSLALH